VKKVLIITYYWPPSGGAGVQRWLKFVKYLPESGIDPIVLTVDPRYAFYPQSDETLVKDIPQGVRIFKTKSFEALKFISWLFGKDKVAYGGFSNVNKKNPLQTLLRFIRGNLFIPDARIGWNRYAVKKAREIIREHDIRTVITTGPPHSTHLTGMRLKKDLNIKWIADFRDPWTDIFYYDDLMHTPVAKRIDLKKERNVLTVADRIITNCDSNKDLLLSKTGSLGRSKFSVITNGFDEDDFDVPDPEVNEFVITYMGTISDHYKPQVFFMVLSELRKKFPDVTFRFKITGNISLQMENLIKDHGIYDIFDYMGYVSHDQLAGFLKGSSALLYIFPETTHEKGIAGKLFEYLASERPIIALGSVESDASDIIRECDAGRSFTRKDSSGLLEYLESLVKIFMAEGRVKAGNGLHRNYSRKRLTEKLKGIILDLDR
jgi:glycosyltransferase involved in cell wall biosynthesis